MGITVLGHINPDTDTVCSAIAYAWYLKTAQGRPAEAGIAGVPGKETSFVLEKFGIPVPRMVSGFAEGDQLVLVDTNNPEEMLAGYEKAELLEIVDHHKLFGGLHTAGPITVTMRPVACTCTVLLGLMGDAEIPREIAGLMLAAILSDTLKFTSPTTTDEDRAAADHLAEIAGVNAEELAEAMFAAKSDLSGMSVRDILTLDSKVMAFGEKRVRISVLETTLPAPALAMGAELEKELAAMKIEEGLDGAFLFIVDIIASASTVLVPSEVERAVVTKAFGVTFDGETALLPGVISRKKQIVPQIEGAM